MTLSNNIISNIVSFANKTIVEQSDKTKEQINNPPHIWLLFFDLIIFCSLTFTTYKASKKLSQTQTEQEQSNNFRKQFIKWLVFANGIRALSLLFIMAIGNPTGNTPISWFNSILHVGPAFLFVSSYMYLATFLIDIYYTNISYNNRLLKPFLVLFVSSGYLILFIIALVTLIFGGYSAFYYISEFLMACLYLVLGTITIYYGRKVQEIFSNLTQNKFDSSNEMSYKLYILSNSIGGLFLIKGLSGVLSAFGYISNQNKYQNVYDFFWFLILEIAPTVIFIIVGKKKENLPNDTPRQSSIYEQENSFNEQNQRSFSYRPPFSK